MTEFTELNWLKKNFKHLIGYGAVAASAYFSGNPTAISGILPISPLSVSSPTSCLSEMLTNPGKMKAFATLSQNPDVINAFQELLKDKQ